jgi:hypothetical protein
MRKSRYGYLWVTLVLFLLSLGGHWAFGWWAYVDEAREHSQQPSAAEYAVQMTRDTLENWQSEFLQLIWQVAGLAFLWYVGSPQSKDGNDRLEEKIDFILSQTAAGQAKRTELDAKYPRT